MNLGSPALPEGGQPLRRHRSQGGRIYRLDRFVAMSVVGIPGHHPTSGLLAYYAGRRIGHSRIVFQREGDRSARGRVRLLSGTSSKTDGGDTPDNPRSLPRSSS